ncbi:MAG: amidohydrolase family protein [Nitrospinota bacterium]
MATEGPQPKVIKNARLVDGTGAPPVNRATVVIQRDTITAVGPAKDVRVPQKAEVLDAKGKTLMPGLIDAHLHLFGIRSYEFLGWAMEPPAMHAIRSVYEVQRILEAGITTICDLGSDNALFIKKAVEEGSIVGPRVRAVGRFMCQTGGIPDLFFLPIETMEGRGGRGFCRLVDGVGECLRAGREQLRDGATELKIGTTGGIDPSFIVAESAFTVEEISAIASVAHNVGKKLRAHNNVLMGEPLTGIHKALEGGVDAIEHGYWIDDPTLERMAEKGATWVVTIAYLQRAVEHGKELNLHPVYVDKCKRAVESIADTMPRAKKIGVKRAAGSDFLGTPADPHGEEAFELEMQVRCGLTEMEAIVAATKLNAEFFGLNTGTVEKGKLADLILVDGDPLKDITILQDVHRIKMVMLEGQIRFRKD